MSQDNTPMAALRINLALCIVYVTLGSLVSLLKIDPGYATAIFPPAGIAVAALLIWGNRAWLGVLLGSGLLNAWIALENTEPSYSVLVFVGATATGAVLQALLGASLVRRFVGFPSALDDEREVLLLMLLIGPVASLINASISVSSLFILGLISGADYAFTWFAWWIGETTGAMIAAPMMFIAFAAPRALWWGRRFSVAAPLVIMSAAVVALYAWASQWEEERVLADFKAGAVDTADKLRDSFDGYVNAVESIERLFVSASHVSRENFRDFVQYLIKKPGTQGFSWNPIVFDPERDEFEKNIQREGDKNFQITERNANGEIVRAARRDTYVVVNYIEPMQTNRQAVGFDVSSNAERNKALIKARDTGKAVATERITLVQERGNQAGLLLFYPVYAGSKETLQDRQKNILGFAVGVFRIGDTVDRVVGQAWLDAFDIGIYDNLTTNYSQLYGPEGLLEDAKSSVSWEGTLDVGGRQWTVVIAPSDTYLASLRSWQAWSVLTAGLFVTCVMSIFLLSLTGRSYQVERLVEERTRELNYTINELETYSYSIAHDLRTPLRAIVSFSQILQQEARGKLHGDGEKYLTRIIEAGKLMATLIDDILELARVTRSTIQMERVDLSGACRDICADMSKIEPEHLVETRIQPGVVASGDSNLLRIVLSNLIENAWKFTRRAPNARIEFGQSVVDGETVFYVRDNGSGFDARYADKIFGVFERLHHAEEYDGTGIGLATVQRIIHRHNGWIRAESVPNDGTTFYFSLPERPGAESGCRFLREDPQVKGSGNWKEQKANPRKNASERF